MFNDVKGLSVHMNIKLQIQSDDYNVVMKRIQIVSTQK